MGSTASTTATNQASTIAPTSLTATPAPAEFVCGIGTSPEGLPHLEEFFATLPTTTGIGFVVIQHLSDDNESTVVDVLSRHTALPVHQVVDGDSITGDHVFVIPPGTEMAVFGGKLRLRERPPASISSGPIDLFMASMAAEYGDHAIAVVLSGTGSDGSEGVDAVRTAGGLTLTQDATANVAGMPDQASAAGSVDASMTPSDMPAAIIDYSLSQHRPHLTDPSSDPLSDILAMISSDTGLDFRQYKQSTIQRRLQRRQELAGAENLGTYAAMLQNSRTERDALLEELLIDVSSFFRDPAAFSVLDHEVIPTLLAEASEKQVPVRVWSAACSTGEEAYSLAISFAEARAKMGESSPSVQVFASDIHPGSVAHAMTGRYSAQEVAAIGEERLERYFEPADGGFKARSSLRSSITFSRHNLLTDTPFGRLDLVVCRNMLIYLNTPAQEQVLAGISSGLRVGGYLMLGPSEDPGPIAPDVSNVSAEWRIYRRQHKATGESQQRPIGHSAPTARPITPRLSSLPDQRILRAYDAILEGQFIGAILVSEARELLHTFGTAGEWMQPPTGRPSLDVLTLISDPALRLAIRATLSALNDSETPVSTPVLLDSPTGSLVVDLIGKRVEAGSGRYFLLFVQPSDDPNVELQKLPVKSSLAEDNDIAKLEADLAYTWESLQTAVEQQEISNEELNAANDELTAANEELRSTNDELSSVNEELRTVNDEHQRRQVEIRDLSADLDHLLNDSGIGAIFLDSGLRVRRFSESARTYFQIRDTDLGRPVADLVSHLDLPDLVTVLNEVHQTGTPYSATVGVSTGGPELLALRVATYRVSNDRIGVYIEFRDISALVKVEAQHAAFRRLLNKAPIALMGKTSDGEFWYRNRLAAELSEVAPPSGQPSQAGGQDPSEGGLNLTPGLSPDDQAVQKKQEALTTFEIANLEGRAMELLLLRFPLEDQGVGLVGIDLSGTDAGRELLQEQSLRVAITQNLKTDVLVDRGNGFRDVGSVGAALGSIFENDLARVHPDDRDQIVAAAANLQLGTETRLTVRVGTGRNYRHTEAQFVRTPTGQKAVLLVDRHEESQRIARLESEVARLQAQMDQRSEAYEDNLDDLAARNADLDSFAHAAAHDLKAPVRAMVSFSEMAIRNLEPQHPAQEHLDRILTGSLRMGALVDSLLRLASAGRDQLSRVGCSLEDIIAQVQTDLEVEISEIEGSIEIGEMGVVLGDRTALVSVISNVVRNSLKYVDGRRPEVEMEFEADNGYGTLVISDNGIGFDPAQSRAIFEPFRRLHSRDTYEGSGVGLAVCKRLIERLEGEIWARGRPGVGTEVSIRLPLPTENP